MVIINVISPTEKTKGSAASFFMIMIFGIIILSIFLFYMLVSGKVTRLYESDNFGFYQFLSFTVLSLILIVYLYFYIKRKGVWIAEKIGTLLISKEAIIFNSKEGTITLNIQDIVSVKFIYGGINVRVCDDHQKMRPSSINVITKHGETYRWNVVIPDRCTKNELAKNLEALTETKSELIIDDFSGSSSRWF